MAEYFEHYLRKRLSDGGVVLIDDNGVEYKFRGYEPRHEDMSFVFEHPQRGIIQKTYESIRHWKVKESTDES